MTQLELGQKLKEEGQALCESNNAQFVDRMRQAALIMAGQNGSVTVDDLRDYAGRLGIQPKSKAAWGCIFKGPGWKSVGFVRTRRPSSHARFIMQWQYVDAA